MKEPNNTGRQTNSDQWHHGHGAGIACAGDGGKCGGSGGGGIWMTADVMAVLSDSVGHFTDHAEWPKQRTVPFGVCRTRVFLF